MIGRIFAAVCLTFGTVLTPELASAAIVDESVSYGTQRSPLEAGSRVPLSVGSFERSLGTLTGITITLLSHDTVTSSLRNFNGQNQPSSQGLSGFSVQVSALGGVETTASPEIVGSKPNNPSLNRTQGREPRSPSEVGGQNTTGQVFAQNTIEIAPSAFSLYETLKEVDFDVTVSGLPANFGTGPSGLVNLDGTGFSYGAVVIRYYYVPIPEADTVAVGLTALGVCGVGFARRLLRLALGME
jgi:hypothetical protein